MAELAQRQTARLHDVESVMERLNVGRSTVFAKITSGELRSVKVGRRRLVSESALVEFIEHLDTGGNTAELNGGGDHAA
jgi:excisionase family DNA binding protein